MHLFSNRSQMTSKCGKNKKAIAECVTDVLTTFWRPLWSIYWTDARQYGIYLFYTIKKNTQLQLFISKSFSITRKPAFAHFGKHEKKPFDVICFLYKMKQSHWLLFRNKELWLVKKNHATVKLDSNGFSWRENLQRSWTAKICKC